jgi:hypothetical protein
MATLNLNSSVAYVQEPILRSSNIATGNEYFFYFESGRPNFSWYNMTKWENIYQMTIEYSKLFHFKAFTNRPKL